LCLLLVWSGIACAQQSSIEEESMPVWVLDEIQTTLRVTLLGEGSSGYSWSLTAEPEGLIEISEIENLSEDNTEDEEPIPGAGRDISFIIVAAQLRSEQGGDVVLTCVWERSWIEDELPAKVLELPLLVREDGTLEVTNDIREVPPNEYVGVDNIDIADSDSNDVIWGDWECLVETEDADDFIFFLHFTEPNQVTYAAGWYLSEIVGMYTGQYTIENGDVLKLEMTEIESSYQLAI